MRKLITVFVVVLCFLALLALGIAKLFFSHTNTSSTTSTTQNPFASATVTQQSIHTTSPEETIRTCYSWYIRASAAGANAALTSNQSIASQCFTQNFISQWQAIIERSGSDPVLLAQDTGKTWQSSIQILQAAQSVNSIDEQVTLGTGEEAHIFIVHLIRSQNQNWYIDAVNPVQS